MKRIEFYIDRKLLVFNFSDLLFLFLFFCSYALLPLFVDLTWISTVVILPLLFLLSLKFLNFKLFFKHYFIKRFLIIFYLAIFSILFIDQLELYFDEIEKILSVLISVLIIYFLISKNLNNLWILYFIFSFKFCGMFLITYFAGIFSEFNPELSRLKSGSEIGINANAYGYFSFISLVSVGLICHYFKNHIFKIYGIIIFILSVYINILAASRAGFLFNLLVFFLIIFSLYYKSFSKLFLKSFFLGVISSIIGFYVLSNFDNLLLFQRYSEFGDTGEDERLIILKNGLELLISNPLGVGAGHFPIEMEKSSLNKIAASHNSFLLIFSNYGFFAFLIFLSIFFTFFMNSLLLFFSKFIFFKRLAFLFLSFIVLFFFYNFFYDMVLNLYIMSFFFCLTLHLNFILNYSNTLNDTIKL